MTRFRSFFLAMLTAVSLLAISGYNNVASAPAAAQNPAVDESPATAHGPETIVLAGGCFWGIQAVFEHTKGVISATSGYSGGTLDHPGYEDVSSGTTGHAESVKIVYDPSRITFGQLLKIFFSVAHDPTELNRQGPDVGTQYRSAIFFANADQQRIAQAYVDQLERAKVFPRPIVTQIVPFKAFYPAEAYHQDYALHHPSDPYIAFNDLPKVKHLSEQFPELYVDYH